MIMNYNKTIMMIITKWLLNYNKKIMMTGYNKMIMRYDF